MEHLVFKTYFSDLKIHYFSFSLGIGLCLIYLGILVENEKEKEKCSYDLRKMKNVNMNSKKSQKTPIRDFCVKCVSSAGSKMISVPKCTHHH